MRIMITIFALFIFTLSNSVMNAQEKKELKKNTIGIRFGGGDGAFTEASYQHLFDQHNRIEADFGYSASSYWSSWAVTAMYQWVMSIKGDFYWYLGGGPNLGHWNEVYVDYYGNDGGMYFSTAVLLGAEYYFPSIPLQLSIDIRPEIAIANRWDSVGGGFGFAIRYVF
jgi:hypothetical protein